MIEKKRILIMNETLREASKLPEEIKKIVQSHFFKMYVKEVLDARIPFKLTSRFPINTTIERSNVGLQYIFEDLKMSCNTLGIYNDFAEEPESDPYVRQFLMVSFILPDNRDGEDCNEEIETLVYIEKKSKRLIFRFPKHIEEAKRSIAYKINGVSTESPAKAAYRSCNWQEINAFQEGSSPSSPQAETVPIEQVL